MRHVGVAVHADRGGVDHEVEASSESSSKLSRGGWPPTRRHAARRRVGRGSNTEGQLGDALLGAGVGDGSSRSAATDQGDS